MEGIGIRRIMQVALTVDDLEKGIGFYERTLGLKPLFRAGRMAFFECGGVRVLVSDENTTATRTLLYFEVDDIHAAWDALGKRDARLGEAPRVIARVGGRDVWLATFHDPSGTLHHLMSETAAA